MVSLQVSLWVRMGWRKVDLEAGSQPWNWSLNLTWFQDAIYIKVFPCLSEYPVFNCAGPHLMRI